MKEIAETLRTASERRSRNGAFPGEELSTSSVLKHCAGEVVEAVQAYEEMIGELRVDVFGARDFQEKFEGELADVICCCLIVAAGEGMDIERVIYDCVEKNVRRSEGRGDKP